MAIFNSYVSHYQRVMRVKQCHKPSPIHHNVYRWYVYRMFTIPKWVVYDIVLPCFTHIIIGLKCLKPICLSIYLMLDADLCRAPPNKFSTLNNSPLFWGPGLGDSGWSTYIRASIEIHLLSIDFPFEAQRNLLIRQEFKWNPFMFNSCESTFNWFPLKTSKKSIDKNGFQLKSIYFQFMWIYFQSIFLLKIRKILIRKDFNWNHFTFNSCEPTFNWFSC